ncbi:MAG: translation initiation factor eIF-1A [Candidatus Hadarchaeaceae archaeon]|nr:translation initiation factor eIF-1A [Hadesarchaea archaeon]MDH5685393.1 translation initiation factor eIF-1A [Hadesarchaea archaeon]
MPKRKKLTPGEEIERIRMPSPDEVLGVVEQMFGFDHLRVRCKDGHVRVCRIRGKIRKRLWVRENDVVIIRPWSVQSDKKGDVIYRYTRTQVGWLRRKGIWE